MTVHLGTSPDGLRAAEAVALLSLATDLGTGLPLEHGLESTLVALRLCERMGVDQQTASHTYYGCLLFYIGCTADAEIVAGLFPGEDAVITHITPVMFGSPPELLTGLFRALASGRGSGVARVVRAAGNLPRAAREQRDHLAAICEVAQMLTGRLGLSREVQALFSGFTERWDGKGGPRGVGGDAIPLPVRIVHVARDATFHRMLGGPAAAADTVRRRAGAAFDPEVAGCLVRYAREILGPDEEESAWDEVLAREPGERLVLQGAGVDRALDAMGDFADLITPWFAGHSSRVAALAERAADLAGLKDVEMRACRRAGAVHDLGRVAVPVRVWEKSGALTADEWEAVRLHPYRSERILARSQTLAPIATIAGAHHERVDGSGYYRGVTASSLSPAARLLAAADFFQAMTEPRPHRTPLASGKAAERLGQEASAGRFDPDAAAAVIEATGHPPAAIQRPAGLTDREAEVIGLLARGCQTKQVGRRLGISVKTADRHIQNAYGKIGISTRAAAALFAMEHGLVPWGELPISGRRPSGIA
jgi:HD-GYP domain-containing protein (c-di-GMP phosphodiesterase class II)